MAECFRHCGQHDAHGSTAGQPYAHRPRQLRRRLERKCTDDRRRVAVALQCRLHWRLPASYTHAGRSLWGGVLPAAVLRWTLCDPRLSGGRSRVEGCGRVFPALSGKPRLQKRSWPVINTTSAATRTLMMPMKMKGRQATMTPLAIILPQAGTTRHRQQAAPAHTRILCQGSSPAVPQTCHHILPCHSLHASHDISERIVWRKMVSVS